MSSGGFFRYSTNERWLVPHFEKMLYDNALLEKVYAYRLERTALRRGDKVLAAWNGLTLAALARAELALNEPRYLDPPLLAGAVAPPHSSTASSGGNFGRFAVCAHTELMMTTSFATIFAGHGKI